MIYKGCFVILVVISFSNLYSDLKNFRNIFKSVHYGIFRMRYKVGGGKIVLTSKIA